MQSFILGINISSFDHKCDFCERPNIHWAAGRSYLGRAQDAKPSIELVQRDAWQRQCDLFTYTHTLTLTDNRPQDVSIVWAFLCLAPYLREALSTH